MEDEIISVGGLIGEKEREKKLREGEWGGRKGNEGRYGVDVGEGKKVEDILKIKEGKGM